MSKSRNPNDYRPPPEEIDRWEKYRPTQTSADKIREFNEKGVSVKFGDPVGRKVTSFQEQAMQHHKPKVVPIRTVKSRAIDYSDGQPTLDIFERVEGLLPMRGKVGVLGKYKSAKSLFCTAVGIHIALGKPLNDRLVEQCRVLHVMSEGDHMRNKNRIIAWCRANEVDPKDLLETYIPISGTYDLSNTADHLIRDINQYCGAEKCGVVIIDPLIKNFAGNENAADDMMAFMNNADVVQNNIEGLVIIPHHQGKSGGKTARGSTAYEGDLDAVLQVSKSGTQVRIENTVARDTPDGDVLKAKIHAVDHGNDPRGRKVTSPALVFVEKVEIEEAVDIEWVATLKKSSPNQMAIVDMLFGYIAKHGKKPDKDAFVEFAAEHWPDDPEHPREMFTKRRDVKRAIDGLKKKSILADEGMLLGFNDSHHKDLRQIPSVGNLKNIIKTKT